MLSRPKEFGKRWQMGHLKCIAERNRSLVESEEGQLPLSANTSYCIRMATAQYALCKCC